MRILALVFLATGFCSLLGSQSEAPDATSTRESKRTRILGTRVSIVVPDGFEPAADVAGIRNVLTAASVFVGELAAPYSELETALQVPSLWTRKGMDLVSAEPLSTGEFPGTLLRLSQDFSGSVIQKWMWYFGSEEATVTITGMSYGEHAGTELDLIRATVLSAQWEPGLTLDPLEGLPFRFQGPTELEYASRLQNVVTFSAPPEGGETQFTCGPGTQPLSVGPRKFAARRLRQVATYRRVQVESHADISIDGLQGVLTIATGERSSDRRPTVLFQVVLLEGAGFYLMQGFAPLDSRESALPLLDSMARRFRRQWVSLRSKDGRTELTVPSSWSIRSGLHDDADLQVGHPTGDCYAIVFSEPRADFAPGMTLEEYSEQSRPELDEGPAPAEADELTIQGMRAIRADVVAEVEGVSCVYRHVSLRGRTHYHQVVLWVPERVHDRAAGDMDAILNSFRELH